MVSAFDVLIQSVKVMSVCVCVWVYVCASPHYIHVWWFQVCDLCVYPCNFYNQHDQVHEVKRFAQLPIQADLRWFLVLLCVCLCMVSLLNNWKLYKLCSKRQQIMLLLCTYVGLFFCDSSWGVYMLRLCVFLVWMAVGCGADGLLFFGCEGRRFLCFDGMKWWTRGRN